MNVIDTVVAETLQSGDLVRITDSDGSEVDIVNLHIVTDDGNLIHVMGESIVEGDSVEYTLEAFDRFDLLGA